MRINNQRLSRRCWSPRNRPDSGVQTPVLTPEWRWRINQVPCWNSFWSITENQISVLLSRPGLTTRSECCESTWFACFEIPSKHCQSIASMLYWWSLSLQYRTTFHPRKLKISLCFLSSQPRNRCWELCIPHPYHLSVPRARLGLKRLEGSPGMLFSRCFCKDRINRTTTSWE